MPITIPVQLLSNSRKSNNICLIHVGRCGSTLLGHMLNQNKDIHWEGKKLFRPLHHHKSHQNTNYITKFLKFRMLGNNSKYYGIEYEKFLSHLKAQEIVNCLKELNFDHYIILERKNYLRSIISMVKAVQYNHWHVRKGSEHKHIPLVLDPSNIYGNTSNISLIEELNRFQTFYTSIRESLKKENFKLLELTYEDDILKDPTLAYNKVAVFLNLEFKEPSIRFGQTNPYPLNETIENIQEIRNYLKDQPFNWMLDE